MRATLPAALLARPQPYRGGVFEDQGDYAQSWGMRPRGADRGDGPGARRSYGPRCTRVLPPLRIPYNGLTVTTNALVRPGTTYAPNPDRSRRRGLGQAQHPL